MRNEAKRLWHFVKGADANTTKTQKETMFIQMLEGLHQDEAKVLLGMKNKSLNKMYKGLTESMVKEALVGTINLSSQNKNRTKPTKK